MVEATTVIGVYPTIGIPDALVALAHSQGGVFSTTQAEILGVSRTALRRMHRDHHWQPVAAGISATTAEPPWLGLAWAGVLQCDDGVLGGQAAAHLYGLCAEPKVIDVWSVTRRRLSQPLWRFRRGSRRGFGDPPRLRIEEAALEICRDGSDADVVEVLAKAVGTRRTTPQRLRRAAANAPNLQNRRLILEVLTDVADGVESPLEHRYLIDVERAHGLPVGTRQISMSRGTRSDVGYLGFGILVELDGRVWHEGLAAASLDMERDNLHALASFTTLRFGWLAVADNPCRVASHVATALHQGGWSGDPVQCSRCP